jgi:hypothetical protein
LLFASALIVTDAVCLFSICTRIICTALNLYGSVLINPLSIDERHRFFRHHELAWSYRRVDFESASHGDLLMNFIFWARVTQFWESSQNRELLFGLSMSGTRTAEPADLTSVLAVFEIIWNIMWLRLRLSAHLWLNLWARRCLPRSALHVSVFGVVFDISKLYTCKRFSFFGTERNVRHQAVVTKSGFMIQSGSLRGF